MQSVRSNDLFKDNNSNIIIIASCVMGSGPNLRMVYMYQGLVAYFISTDH